MSSQNFNLTPNYAIEQQFTANGQHDAYLPAVHLFIKLISNLGSEAAHMRTHSELEMEIKQNIRNVSRLLLQAECVNGFTTTLRNNLM